MMPAAIPLASSAQDIQPDKALPSTRQGPSLCWEGRREGLSPLRGGMLASEDISPIREKVAYERRLRTSQKTRPPGTWRANPTGISPITPRECAWRTRDGSPLRRTCRRHHYHGRCGNDGQYRLVESHRCSTPGGVKDNSGPSPIGLCHRPKSCDIYHACNLTTVVSP
jgi:hypothetical protein